MREKGITLIALVITIIVLLILSIIGLSMLLGENGILYKARTAKENSEVADIEEQNRLGKYNEYIDTKTTSRSTSRK